VLYTAGKLQLNYRIREKQTLRLLFAKT
jgi:hypothetical protein